MHIIPLHSVCFAFGDDPVAVDRVMGQFSADERLLPDSVRNELFQGQYFVSAEHVITDEIEHRMLTRLRLGLRTVINGEQLSRKVINHLLQRAMAFGTSVFAFVCANVESMAYRGAEIIDARATDIRPVQPLPVDFAAEYLGERYRGITAVGDVHGSYSALRSALDWARQRGHFVVLAGDVVDYGPGSLEVADEVYRLVTRGDALLITGNHERKILRWGDGYRVRLSEGNRVTTLGLMELSDASRTKWQGRFRGLFRNSRLVQRIANLTFAHAAVHPSLWRQRKILLNEPVENFALFGEIDEQKTRTDRPVSSFRWVDAIPDGEMAVVGHTIRSRTFPPYLQTNDDGGSALFLDTGAGKGGILSSADFRFHNGALKLENFNIY